MTLSLKLILLREFKNWKPENVANKIGIDIESYLKIEKGKAKINGTIAQSFSDLYSIPIEFFLIADNPYYTQAEVVFSNCTFNGGGTNGYINHQYNDRGIDEILFSKNEEIKNLKKEIAQLKKNSIHND